MSKISKISNTIEIYKVVCINYASNSVVTSNETLQYGFIVDKPIPVKTLLKITQYYSQTKMDKSDLKRHLFTKKEMEDGDVFSKVIAQLAHYWSFGTYGIQEVKYKGKTITVDILKVVDKAELSELVRKDVYGNTPLSSDKVEGVVEIIKDYKISIEGNLIKNNEIKALLYESGLFEFSNGDDIVRYIVFKETGSPLLIKSRQVLNDLKEVTTSDRYKTNELLANNSKLLSQVFNRHKKIFLALKNDTNRTAINTISKLSKTNHVPLRESINKTFIAKALAGKINNYDKVLDNISIFDKLKYLNLLRIRKQEMENKFFLIRNGTCFYKTNMEKWSSKHEGLYNFILKNVQKQLSYLRGKKIKYPDNVDYGLPISNKQSLGHLPFGTIITTDGKISAGMYWEDSWGAHDLDLSAISLKERLGWGSIHTYESENDLLFSGDITNAPDGAIEFMTQNKKSINPHVLINTIYAGDDKAKYKLVVGQTSSKKYLKNTIVEIETSFSKRSEILGVIKSNKFIVYKAGISSVRISSERDKAFLPYIDSNLLTIKGLLADIGISLHAEKDEYDFDLSVDGITFDKLREIFEDGAE